jgi:hypothetical protein
VRHVAGAGGLIVAEVVETESGNQNARPELARALAACRAHRATLSSAAMPCCCETIQARWYASTAAIASAPGATG